VDTREKPLLLRHFVRGTGAVSAGDVTLVRTEIFHRECRHADHRSWPLRTHVESGVISTGTAVDPAGVEPATRASVGRCSVL
jgi:hypothetical protein